MRQGTQGNDHNGETTNVNTQECEGRTTLCSYTTMTRKKFKLKGFKAHFFVMKIYWTVISYFQKLNNKIAGTAPLYLAVTKSFYKR